MVRFNNLFFNSNICLFRFYFFGFQFLRLVYALVYNKYTIGFFKMVTVLIEPNIYSYFCTAYSQFFLLLRINKKKNINFGNMIGIYKTETKVMHHMWFEDFICFFFSMRNEFYITFKIITTKSKTISYCKLFTIFRVHLQNIFLYINLPFGI